MKKISVSSVVKLKGQVTIPQVIRQLMGIDTGDNVKFDYEDGNVTISKDIPNNNEINNILELLLQKKIPVVISGVAGAGKTHFIKQLIESFLRDKSITIVEPLNQIQSFIEENHLNMDDISFKSSLEWDAYSEYVIVEEANKYPVEENMYLLQKSYLFLVYQDLREASFIEKYISVKVHRDVQEISVIDNSKKQSVSKTYYKFK